MKLPTTAIPLFFLNTRFKYNFNGSATISKAAQQPSKAAQSRW